MLRRVSGWLRTGTNWILALGGTVAALFAIVAMLEKALGWGALSWLQGVGNVLWSLSPTWWVAVPIVVLAVGMGLIYIDLRQLKEYVAPTFSDDFTKPLERNWDYDGKWELTRNRELT